MSKITEKDVSNVGRDLNNVNNSDIGQTIDSSILHVKQGNDLSIKTNEKLENALTDGRVSKEHKKLIKKILT